ncbi:MAG: ABC transporter ATP-binding protein [Clostridium sp.]|nr:ABC transporter ATP-binding protein [Clostridium sp.]MCM1568562.1 ABC transporter ATP-binding protein [Roseburia sp.]
MGVIAELQNICKQYGLKESQVNALIDVNLKVNQGEFITIVGASGSGKTTLLNILGGIDCPTAGKVIIDGTDITTWKEEKKAAFRRSNIGIIYQNFNLLPMLTVYENIVLPVQMGGEKEDEVYIRQLIRDFGLSDLENRLPNQLSGGQQQRVAIARALVARPKIVLADEPTGNLDSENSEHVIDCILKSSKEYGQTIVMITHNTEIAKRSQKIYVMKDGVLSENKA